jgi:hypothetical protein
MLEQRLYSRSDSRSIGLCIGWSVIHGVRNRGQSAVA